jgi:hypothetical protein
MFSDDIVADGPVADFRPVRPARLPRKLADQLIQLGEVMAAIERGEVPVSELRRWRAVVAEAARVLHRPGAPTKGAKAVQYIKEEMAKGRRLDAKLKAEAARRAGCTTETVRDWWNRLEAEKAGK